MSEYKIHEYNQKRQGFENLKKKYSANGSISWATFSADQSAHKEKAVSLTNDDFAHGTLRIFQPCMLVLTEDIQFNPNRPTTWLTDTSAVTSDFSQAASLDPDRELDWMPKKTATNNAQYFEPEVKFAYTLGFFAAIAIEATDIIINLNNKTLEQHQEHALQQRFYANIELADQPFLPLQGPSNFGWALRSALNVFIFNGTLGKSSHHGIHGNNGGNYVMIENIDVKDFEIAGIALNGFKNVYMRNVNVINNLQSVPVLATYSAARFAKVFVSLTEKKGYDTPSFITAKNALYTQMDGTFNSIIFDNGTVNPLFENTSGLIDGISYGFLLGPNGVAVNQFLEGRDSSKCNESTNVLMFYCNIANIKTRINEIVTLSLPNSEKAQIDTGGATLQFFNGVSNLVGDKYYYGGTVLSDVQIELAKIKHTLVLADVPTVFMGVTNLHKGIQDWKDNSGLYFKLVDHKLHLYNANGTPYIIDSEAIVYDVLCGGDAMFHLIKGEVGMRVDGVNNMYISDCGITQIRNEGVQGSLLDGNYTASHPSTGTQLIGYQGAKTYGITFAAVNNIVTNNLQVSCIESVHGAAHGIVIMNNSLNCTFNDPFIDSITSNKDGTFDPDQVIMPNEVPVSKGIVVTHDCHNIKIKNSTVKNTVNQINSPYNSPYDYQINVSS